MFADVVDIKVKAGKGGNGLSSFRREKFIDRGGPDGGDGGQGGSIIILADNNTNTLAQYRNAPELRAEDGENGKRQRMHGKNGEDTVLRVPLGTVVWDKDMQLADLSETKPVIVAAGGRGGFGNAHFKSSVRQAPRVAEIGEPGEEKLLRLELKLMADVGLVGLPNAGKSTLLSVISNAKPAIASYPFTTKEPILGVVNTNNQTLLVADIPGLIEGASTGKGLGHTFLRHVERTSVLLHLIDATEDDVAGAYKTITEELKSYPAKLDKKPRVVVLTKIDALDSELLEMQRQELQKVCKAKILNISASAHRGLDELLEELAKVVAKQRSKKNQEPVEEEIPILGIEDDPNAWWVEKSRAKFVVKGVKIEGFGRRTDVTNDDGLARLRNIFHKQGIDRELVRLGVKVGDKIEIADKTFQW